MSVNVGVYNFTPFLAGYNRDPQLDGGSVDELRVYTDSARTVPTATVTGATRVHPFIYQFALPDTLTAGRYWLEVDWTPGAELAGTVTTDAGRVDLPVSATLVVSPEDVATRLGLALPVSDEQRAVIVDHLIDAQAGVEAELGRTLIPSVYTAAGELPLLGVDVSSARAWPQLADFYNDKITIVGTKDNGDGSYDVTFAVGLDGRAEEPITRFVRASAVEALRDNPSVTFAARRVMNVSADGQSVSYGSGAGWAKMTAGAVPDVKSLTRYKRRAVFQRRRWADPPWPYDSTAFTLGGWMPTWGRTS